MGITGQGVFLTGLGVFALGLFQPWGHADHTGGTEGNPGMFVPFAWLVVAFLLLAYMGSRKGEPLVAWGAVGAGAVILLVVWFWPFLIFFGYNLESPTYSYDPGLVFSTAGFAVAAFGAVGRIPSARSSEAAPLPQDRLL